MVYYTTEIIYVNPDIERKVSVPFEHFTDAMRSLLWLVNPETNSIKDYHRIEAISIYEHKVSDHGGKNYSKQLLFQLYLPTGANEFHTGYRKKTDIKFQLIKD